MIRFTFGFLVLCALAGYPVEVVWAQDGEASTESPASSDGEDSGRATDDELAEDRAADLRDAINENLVPESKSADASVEAPEEPDTPAEPADPDSEAEEEEVWYQKFETVTTRVQTLPERIPGLAGKGWLHFGRVELEAAHFSHSELDDDSGFNFRSLRGGLIRQYNERLTLKFEIDATDGDSNWVDLWARFNTQKLGVFTIGNQKIAQTLVNQTSRLSRTFLEEPLPADAFGLGRRVGVGWDVHLRKVGAHLTAFGPDLNENIGKFGYGFRLYTNPARTQFTVVHLGASAVQEKMDRDAQFRAYPETRVTDVRLVDTLRQADVNTQSIFGVEAAIAQNAWSIRAEAFAAKWERDNLSDSRFQGYYLQANWAITGESFQYTQGKFLRLRPRGHRGAWEVGFRYSWVDLNDDEIEGGEQTNASLALNWYGPGRQLRLMGAVIYADVERQGRREQPLIVQLRAQLHW